MTEQEKQQILDMHNQGYCDWEIAQIMFYSPTWISETLRGMGIVRPRGRRCKIPLQRIKQICEMRSKGMSYNNIAKEFGMCKHTVIECVKREERHGRFHRQAEGD